jgi:hypothetical protein
MTVFGFGRQGMNKYLDKAPARFSIALLESTRHDVISKWVESARRP